MSRDVLSRDEAEQRAATISALRYAVHLDLSDSMQAETFTATLAATFDSQEGASTFLDFEGRSAEAWLNGKKLPASAFDGKRIALSGLRAKGNELKVVGQAEYHSDGVGLHRIQDPADGSVYLYTHSEPFDAHLFFPCFDQPDIKAPLTMSVTAPSTWKVIGNSVEARTEAAPDGKTTHHFATTRTISTYLDALVAGPYESVSADYVSIPTGAVTPMRLLCRKSMMPYLEKDEIFEITRQGLQFFEEFFGIPYPFEKYDQVFVAEFNMGAMENPGCVTFNEGYLFRSRVTEAGRGSRASVILHEMAHMWFGDLVTMKWWDDLWLNESFATFMSVIAQMEATRFPMAWRSFAERVKGSVAADQLSTTHPIVADAFNTEVAQQNFDGITYGKGAATLRQLYAWVGRDAFQAGVSKYLKAHSWGNATLADFMDELGRASGRDMSYWRDSWLKTSGINTLTPEVQFRDGKIASLIVRQTAEPARPTLRPHRIGVGLFSRDGSGKLVWTKTVEVDLDGEATDVSAALAGESADALLLNDGNLTFAKVNLDSQSREQFLAGVDAVQDPLRRKGIADAMWEMVRDAALPARSYISFLYCALASEPDVDALKADLASIATAIGYAHPSARATLRRDMASFCRTRMENATAGSDEQLVFAQEYFAHADERADVERFERILAGAETVPGLVLDPAVRWALASVIAEKGSRPERTVAREESLDATDFGQRNAAALRASYPSAAAKARAWSILTRAPGEKSLKLLQAVASGFQRWGQDHLTRPYTPGRYERLVSNWWQQLSPDRAKALTTGLFPAAHGDQTLGIALADRLIAKGGLPAPAVRVLTETRENLVRVQRAQALDLLSAPKSQGLQQNQL